MWDTRTTDNGGASIMSVLFIIIVIWAIFGGGFGGFGGNAGREFAGGNGYNCHDKSNCDAMMQEMKDNYENRIAADKSTAEIIATSNANTRLVYDQSARQWEANLQEKIFDAKLEAQTNAILTSQALYAKDNEIATLKAEKYIDAKFDRLTHQVSNDYNELRAGQAALACEMPKRPTYYAQGFINCGQPVPQGFNGYSNC